MTGTGRVHDLVADRRRLDPARGPAPGPCAGHVPAIVHFTPKDLRVSGSTLYVQVLQLPGH